MADCNETPDCESPSDALAGETILLQALELCSLHSVPMAIKAAINLNVFEILAKAGADAALSAQEIVAGIATSNPQAHIALDRILRLLASHSVLSSKLENGRTDGEVVTKYGLNPLSMFMCQSGANGSLAPLVLLNHESKAVTEPWFRLHESVLYAGIPFERIMGKNNFLYYRDDEPALGYLFASAMVNHSLATISRLLDVYDGFHGLNSLVDVGGGMGSCLSMILAKYPHVRGINFDLPYVIAASPPYPGIQHVAGDMFESVPSADAVFMKWILHDWTDERCIQLLKNCHRAVPENGKVIVVESTLPAGVETDVRSRVGYQMDLIMLATQIGGKERTMEEFRELANAAGFSGMRAVCSVNELTVMEFFKSP